MFIYCFYIIIYIIKLQFIPNIRMYEEISGELLVLSSGNGINSRRLLIKSEV